VSEATAVEQPTPAAAERPRPWARVRRGGTRPGIYAGHQYVAVAAFTVFVALVGPRIGGVSRSNQFLVNLWLVYVIAGLGFYWIFSLAGRFAFCQTFMMALGGYTSAWVTRSGPHGKPFLLGVLCAMLITAFMAFLIGGLVHRSPGLYFAIATLAVTTVGNDVFAHWSGFAGRNGVTTAIAPPRVLGHTLLKDKDVFWLFLGALVVVLLLAVMIERSPLRRDAIAGRDNLLVARLAGVPTGRNQLSLFALGSALGGLSGALIGHWQGVVSSDTFGIDLAIGIFLMLFLGGVGSMWGPVLGGAFYVAIPEWLSSIQRYNTVVYGGLLLVVVMLLPQGLVGLGQKLLRWVQTQFRRSRPKEAASADG
jgi:branched-chain amino acid transport system permease protein